MKFTLKIEMDNDAFQGVNLGVYNGYTEVAKLLRVAATQVERGNWDFKLMDSNGNTVGAAKKASR